MVGRVCGREGGDGKWENRFRREIEVVKGVERKEKWEGRMEWRGDR